MLPYLAMIVFNRSVLLYLAITNTTKVSTQLLLSSFPKNLLGWFQIRGIVEVTSSFTFHVNTSNRIWTFISSHILGTHCLCDVRFDWDTADSGTAGDNR